MTQDPDIDAELSSLLDEASPVDEPIGFVESPTLTPPSSVPVVPIITETELDVSEPSVQKLLRDFQTTENEILQNFRSDRVQIEEVVQHLWHQIRAGQTNPRYVEQLVSALGVKADVAANATKLLEAKAKLLSAGKNTVLVQNQVNNSSVDTEIDDILSRNEL